MRGKVALLVLLSNFKSFQMFPLESERLLLVPVTRSQIDVFVTEPGQLVLLDKYTVRPFDINSEHDFVGEFYHALHEYVVPRIDKDPGNWYWYTFWFICDKESQWVAGSMGINGPPDEKGETLVGYFVDRRFENRGYTTEALHLLLQWIAAQPGAETVIADTLAPFNASQRVLQKNGFTLMGEVEEGLRWRKMLRQL